MRTTEEERHEPRRKPEPEPPARTVQPGAAAQLLALQRSAGNSATAAWIGRATLARFDAQSDAMSSSLTDETVQGWSDEDIEQAIDRLQAELRITDASAPTFEAMKDNRRILLREQALRTGTPVAKIGLVSNDDGVNLRDVPANGSTVLRRLDLNQRLFVERELTGGWLRVVIDGQEEGYVAASHVTTDLPEPNAKLHRLKSGEHALRLVRQYFKGDAIKWGQDERFYTNVLVRINEDAGRHGIYKDAADDPWEATKTKAGSQIWIPSPEFAQSLHGVVSSGSISYEAYVAAGGPAVVQMLRDAFDAVWADGQGVQLDAGIGVTWGYPIYTGASGSLILMRDGDDIIFKRRGDARVAFDTGAGAGISGGSRKTGDPAASDAMGIGAQAAIAFQAGLKLVLFQQFRFPVMTDGAFLPLLIALTGAESGMFTGPLVRILEGLFPALDPMRYHTSTKLEMKAFTEAEGAASFGARTGGTGQGQTWGPNAPEGRHAPNVGQERRYLQDLLTMSASATARAGAEAGVGVEVRTPEWEINEQGDRVPARAELDLYLEAGVAASFGIRLAGIPALGAGLERAVGIKATWIADAQHPDPKLDDPDLVTAYTKSGEDDTHQGAADKIELSVADVDPDKLQTLADVLASVERARIAVRIPAGYTHGRTYVKRAAAGQTPFSSLFATSAPRAGARIEAYLDLTLALDRETVLKIADAIGALSDAARLEDLRDFIFTGTVRPEILAPLKSIASELHESVEEFKLHAQYGALIAGSAQVAEGAKARIHGHLGAMHLIEMDMKSYIDDPEEIPDLLVPGAKKASPELAVEELVAP